MKVALVHYWLVDMRGGERVLEAFCDLFPDADIITNIYRPEALSEKLRSHRIIPTFVNAMPFAAKGRAAYLPLMPIALEQVDMRAYDLVISIESGPAKGIIPRLDAKHLCYCLSPMRYTWDQYHEYLSQSSMLERAVMRPAMHYLRLWDQASASRVDSFVSISRHVQARVRRYYQRDSSVIAPPVRIANFSHRERRNERYLVVSELVGYKRVDLAIDACIELKRPLTVIGQGPLLEAFRARPSKYIDILGWQPDDVVAEHLATCRALIFPGEEDFGIVPVEAMASGAPVIAFGRGGALDTVNDGVTGLLFSRQTVNSLCRAIDTFERDLSFSAAAIHAHAEQFDIAVFFAKITKTLEELVAAPLPEPGRPRA